MEISDNTVLYKDLTMSPFVLLKQRFHFWNGGGADSVVC